MTRFSPLILGLLSGTVALGLYLLIGRLLFVYPGTLVTEEIDVIFSSDAGERWKLLSGSTPPQVTITHPLLCYLWGTPGSLISKIAEQFMAPEVARLYSAHWLVCGVAAAGVGCMMFVVFRITEIRWKPLCMLPIILAFTCTSLVVLPDHFGISFGVFAASSVIFLPFLGRRTRLALVILFGLLLGGTTLTNGLFAALAGTVLFRQEITSMSTALSRRQRYTVGVALVLGCLLVVALGFHRMSRQTTVAALFLNWRLFLDPVGAARLTVFAWVTPAVGPTPKIVEINDHPALTYNFVTLSNYTPLAAIAALAWIALVVPCVGYGIRAAETRPMAVVLLAWVAFNCLFHNIWGDEFFLFSPHWAPGADASRISRQPLCSFVVCCPGCRADAAGPGGDADRDSGSDCPLKVPAFSG